MLAKPIPGRPSKLSAELSWIANTVRDHNPQRFKFEFGLWTLSLIRHLIKLSVQKKLSVPRFISKTLTSSAQSRFTKRGSKIPCRCIPGETETYPRFAQNPKQVSDDLLATSPAFARTTHRHDWRRGAVTPVVRRRAGALAEHDLGDQHAGQFRFMLHEGSVDAKVFIEFLKRLMVNADKPVFLIVDGQQ